MAGLPVSTETAAWWSFLAANGPDKRAARVERLRSRARARFPKSFEHFERALKVVPRGAVRNRFWWPFPIYIERGDGSYLFDLDGNRYIDCVLGFGPLILGHRPKAVISALERQLKLGLMFGATTVEEAQLAEQLVAHVPNAGWVTFVNSGNEATMGAIRIARAATGRQVVAKFEGGWHGWHDLAAYSCFSIGGELQNPEAVPDSVGIPIPKDGEVVVLPFNRPEGLALLREEAPRLACVLVEGVQGGAGAIPADRAFLTEVRRICDELGVLLIMDEVITGFRLGSSGAAGLFNVRPDLSTMGKIIGGGMPVGAICGSAQLKTLMSTGTGSNQMILAGTFSAHPMSMVAGSAQLTALLEDETAYERLDSLGHRMRTGLVAAFSEVGITCHITGTGSLWGTHFTEIPPTSVRDMVGSNREAARVLPFYLMQEGVLVSAPAHLGLLSTAHSEGDVDQVVAGHVNALRAMADDGFFD